VSVSKQGRVLSGFHRFRLRRDGAFAGHLDRDGPGDICLFMQHCRQQSVAPLGGTPISSRADNRPRARSRREIMAVSHIPVLSDKVDNKRVAGTKAREIRAFPAEAAASARPTHAQDQDREPCPGQYRPRSPDLAAGPEPDRCGARGMSALHRGRPQRRDRRPSDQALQT